jgi:hypothetical protein
LLTFQPRDAVFVSLNYLEKCSACIPQRADLPGMLANLPSLFLTFAQKQFDGLRQGFMPPGQSIQPLVNRHKLLPRQRALSESLL